ncbi:MAG: peptidoglycan-binding protein [Bryobacteraceae bacterium]|nr:peptidoglycan-binding protein [Bryobacteraceae bacterium]
MGRLVTVQEGDSLISLAYEAGFLNPNTVWDDEANAELRKLRTPGVLAPGDQIYIPDKVESKRQAATGATHEFVLNRSPAYFSVFLHDECGQPYASCRYELTIDKQQFSGKTASDGLLCHAIRPDSRAGTLKLWPNPRDPSETYEWAVKVGDMDPAGTVRGVKGRLRNLGYRIDELNDEMDDQTREALREFQRHLGRENPTGEVDDETRDALTSLHNGH